MNCVSVLAFGVPAALRKSARRSPNLQELPRQICFLQTYKLTFAEAFPNLKVDAKQNIPGAFVTQVQAFIGNTDK